MSEREPEPKQSQKPLRPPHRTLPLAMFAVIGNVIGGIVWYSGIESNLDAYRGSPGDTAILIGVIVVFASLIVGLVATFRIVSNLDDTAERIYRVTEGRDT